MASIPVARYDRPSWYKEHGINMKTAASSSSTIMIVGDSIAKGLERYPSVWSRYFGPLGTLNFGIGGDLVQNVLWRIEHGEVPSNLRIAVLHCGTNNLRLNTPAEICRGIEAIVNSLLRLKPGVKVIVAGLLPRGSGGLSLPSFRDNIINVNRRLGRWCLEMRNRGYIF